MSDLLAAALDYAARGWFVFPCEVPVPGDARSGKAPVGRLVPRGKNDSTVDPDVIRSWWAQGDWNVGIDLARSDLVVLDVDVAGGKRGFESMAKIDAELTATLVARTGSGGLHALYSRPDGYVPSQKIGFDEGLDLLGAGYIVAAPSRHYTGGTYSWVSDAPIAPLPPILRDVHRAPKIITPAEAGLPIVAGGRNDAMFRVACAVRATGVGPESVRAAVHHENRLRCTPPLTDDEVAGIVASAMRRVQPERDVAIGAAVRALLPDVHPVASDLPDAATALELVPSLVEYSTLPVVRLPFEQLDGRLGGLTMHSITNIIAGTGKGKSSLAGQLAAHHAEHWGPVIYYVAEMTRVQVVARVVGQLLSRSWYDVLHGKVDRAEIERVLAPLPIYFVRRSDDPIQAIADACKRARDAGCAGTPLVVVDYIQLLAVVTADMRVSTLEAVRAFQFFVENAPVVALVLSQTSRSAAGRIREGADHSEELGDVGAETAELERSATNQLVLSYRSKDDVEEHEVTMLITKCRYGGGTRLGFKFNGKTGVWTPMGRPPVDEVHEQRCVEILEQVKIHQARQCLQGEVSCGRELTASSFRKDSRNMPHKVSGSAEDIKRAVDDLVDLKKLRRIGNTLVLP